MGYIAQLTRGNRTVYLDGRDGVKLAMGFTPPETSEVANVSMGLSGNKSGGGWAQSKRAYNRSYVLPLKIYGDTSAHVDANLSRVRLFLSDPGTQAEPLYFEWKPDNTTSYNPTWGQFGASRRVRIVHAEQVSIWENYLITELRGKATFADFGLQIAPYAYGTEQMIGLAGGGIQMDTVANAGISRGLVIPEATTNLWTNPIAGTAGITAAASLVVAETTDNRYTLFGGTAIRLTAIASSNNTLTQSLTLSSTNTISAYIALPGGGTPSSTQAQIAYGGTAQTTTFVNAGGSWWRMYAVVTGTGGALATGFVIKDDYSVIMTGFQVEAKAYPTALAHGDLMSHAWTGTAHASTTTRTVGKWTLPTADILSNHEGSIRIVWKPPVNNTVYGANSYLLHGGTATFTAYFDYSNDKWLFVAGGTATSAAVTFTAGTPVILHYTWGSGYIRQYVNGAENGTAVYTPPTYGASLYLGSDATPANHINGTFMGFEIYDRAMTAAEVSADYTNINAAVSANRMLGGIPTLWTNDGTRAITSDIDATDKYFGYVLGIDGSAPAETIITAYTTESSPLPDTVYLSSAAFENYIAPTGTFALNQAGTIAVSTESPVMTQLGGTITFNAKKYPEAVGLELYPVMDAYAPTATAQSWTFRAKAYLGATYSQTPGLVTYTLGTAALDKMIGNPLHTFERNKLFTGAGLQSYSITTYMGYVSDSGGSIIYGDFLLMPRPMTKLTTVTAGTCTGFVYSGQDAYAAGGAASLTNWRNMTVTDVMSVNGDTIEFQPHKMNLLLLALSDGQDDVNQALNFNLAVIPRWHIA